MCLVLGAGLNRDIILVGWTRVGRNPIPIISHLLMHYKCGDLTYAP
jgi:hypothetical protein